MSARYILSSVWVRLSIFSQLSIIQYMGLYFVQFTQFPHDGWENIFLCLIIIIKSEVWTIIHCLGLGHETMVCAICLFIFLWGQLISIFHSQISAYTSASVQSATACVSKTMVLWRKREAFIKNQKKFDFCMWFIEIGFRSLAKRGPTDLVHTGSKYKHNEARRKFYRQHHRWNIPIRKCLCFVSTSFGELCYQGPNWQ